jgi:hypothetical protein
MHQSASCNDVMCLLWVLQGGGPNVAGSGLDQVVAKARAFEKGNDWARAIETYLSVTAQDSANTDALQRTYMQVGAGAVPRARARVACWKGVCSWAARAARGCASDCGV